MVACAAINAETGLIGSTGVLSVSDPIGIRTKTKVSQKAVLKRKNIAATHSSLHVRCAVFVGGALVMGSL